MNKTIIVLFLFLRGISFACSSINAPTQVNIALDPANDTRYFYNDLKVLGERPFIGIENCIKTAAEDKFLMFSVGLENFVLSDEFLTYSYNDQLSSKDSQCKIENAPLKDLSDQESIYKRLLSRRKFLNECLTFQVTDFAKAGLSVPSNQPGCQVERISDHAINFKGPFCFVKPHAESSIVFSVDINGSCLEEEFLKENKISYQDVLGLLAIYKAGDTTGTSTDLTALKQLNLRASVNADPRLLKTNTETGTKRPTWPVDWNVTSVLPGKVEINSKLSKYDEIIVPLYVNNVCDQKCVDGLCSSSCLYSQPVVGDYRLFEITEKGPDFLYSWYDGGMAPAMWRGMLHGLGAKIQKGLLKEGKKYVVKIDLSDQELNYMTFKGMIKRRLGLRPNHIPRINREGGRIAKIPLLGVIGNISRLPEIEGISGISFSGDGFIGVRRALNSINRVFKNIYWPPYFQRMCSGDDCISAKKHNLELFVEFTYKDGKAVDLKGLKKGSMVAGKQHINDLPHLNCGNDNDSSDDDFDIDFDF
ncbi:hypothetical protein HBN50_09615 [Halobacteriovorax sp. GB3]|uniref:hypothetical protein n=1 Tax=Halobacteriovorax sp. GB3 TaxID=2719615 RepID=UPI002362A204|nr:hypothetical protein [Halobacteriovorax sp. GB3]MDD0853355.1 hypothetical protein [Halobacteriovorax sp. GB3]